MADRNTKFEDLTFKQKIEHIWEYYRLLILGIILGVWLIVYIIVKIVTPEPEVLMHVVLVNANSMEVAEEDTFDRYLAEHGYDPKEMTISVNASMYLDFDNNEMMESNVASQQVLAAMMMIGEIDLLVANEDAFLTVGGNEAMMSVEEILPEELLEKYQDRFYIYTNPETGEEAACGIWLDEKNPLIQDYYYFGKALAGIPYTATNVDLAKEMLLILLGEPVE